MKTYVISLARSAERRAHVRNQLDRLKCPYQFFSAIEGTDGYDFFEGFDERRYLLNTGRMAKDGEIGCYASHLYLWNLCVALGEPIVVMEDDAELDAEFNRAVEAVEALIDRYGFIRLQTEGPDRNARSTPVESVGPFTLSYCGRYAYGAMCYALAPATAEAFIRSSRIVVGPVDFFIKQPWMHGCPLYALSPAVVRGGVLHEESTIGRRDKAQLPAPQRILCCLSKLRSTLGRVFFNLRYRPKRRDHALQSWLSSGRRPASG